MKILGSKVKKIELLNMCTAMAREMVDVVDNFERALSSLKGTEEKTLEGFELIYKEIVQILKSLILRKSSH